jgi:citrate synthase
MKRNYAEITPQLGSLAKSCVENNVIEKSLYSHYNVKRGLRDENGKGVITGLTGISEVNSRTIVDGVEVPAPGELFYRGYSIKDLVKGFIDEKRYGFEEIIYLLLMGELPNLHELKEFDEVLSSYRSLPTSFARDVIMKAPSENIMNSLARSVLTLYSYDKNAEDTSIPNVLRQCIQLIAMFPLLSVYGYQAFDYYIKGNRSLFIHDPVAELSTAENILHMLRPDCKFTQLEARILDLALILHAEHGGGNNSSFTIHVVTSSGTDTYSSVAAALGSLKGPKHGGANIKVCKMFEDIKEHIRDWNDEDEVEHYIAKIINKEAFDRSGLVYGIGHAIYSISDPRALIFKEFVEKLSKEKGKEKEYALYTTVEKIAPKLIAGNKKMYKGVSANVDFYSGFVYEMLEIPQDLFTPLFAIARIAGWSAHRIEELINSGRIIRPAYKDIQPRRSYISMEKR